MIKQIFVNLLFILFCFNILSAQNNSLTSKGGLYTGLSFNFSTKNTDNEDIKLYKIYDQKNQHINLNLDQGYFIQDDFALGVAINFLYNNKIGTYQNTSNIISDIHTKTIGWSIYATMKNYFSLDPEKRFNVFSLIKLGGTDANTLTESITSEILSREYTESNSIALVFYPGLMVRIAEGFAIEGGIEIAGFKGEWSNTKTNGLEGLSESKFTGDFTINVLNIGLGFYYYY